jgi:peptide/nickel transport system substrate-binding protein
MTRFRARSALLVLAAGIGALGVVAAATSAPRATGPSFKNGGTLTVALESDPDALDPSLARTFVGRMVFLDFCEKLYDLNSKLEIVPQLAASLPTLSADKKTATIKLRTGIKFNDGTPFNAAAVKQSLERHKTLKGSARASELAPVTSIDTQGDSTVILHLSDRYSPLTAQLADRSGMIMSPKALNDLGDKFATNPVCVGAYMFKERVAGDHITLVKSPYYYDKKNVHLDSIVWKIIVDNSARAANVRSHDVDVADAIVSTELQGIQHDSSLRLIKATSIGYQGITINIGNKNGLAKLPYQNVGTPIAKSPDLREAFELALDRKVINKVVFGGTVSPDCFPIAPNSPFYAATKGIPCKLTADVAGAKAAFRRSGAPAGVPVKLMLGTDSVAARLGQVIQAMVKPIGFDVEVQPTEFTTSLNREDAGNYETFAIGWSGRIDPDGNTFNFLATTGSQNDSGYSNPTVDRALANERKAASMKARIVSFHAAFAQAAKDRPIIYLYHTVYRDAQAKTVAGVRVYGDGLLRVANAGFKK